MVRKWFTLTVMVFFITTGHALAKDLIHTGQPIVVRMQIGQPTSLIFPEKIAEIIFTGQEDTLLIENSEYTLYLVPKRNNLSDLHVITISGVDMLMRLDVGNRRDDEINIRYSKQYTNQENSTIDLMKTLLRGDIPQGAEISTTEETWIKEDIKYTTVVRYIFPEVDAVVLIAENIKSQAIKFPIQRFELILKDENGDKRRREILAVTSDKDMLTAKEKKGYKTYMYVIAKNEKYN